MELRFWNGFSGPDGKAMEAIVKEYNATHPDVRIKMEIIPWGTYYDKVTLGIASKNAPDVFVLHAPRIAEYAEHDALAPIGDLLAKQGPDEKDFAPLVLQAGVWKGVRYGLPLDCHPLGMYYNEELFAKAGIKHPPTNATEFLDAAKKLTKDTNGDGTPDQWGFVVTDLHLVGTTLLDQYGVSLLGPDRKSGLNRKEAAEALALLRSFWTTQKIAPPTTGDDAWVTFMTGRAGMAFNGIWMIDALERQSSIRYAAAPVPILGPKAAVWAGSHTLAMPYYLDAKRQAAGYDFIKYLSDHSLTWAKGGQVPVRKSILASSEFQSLRIQREFAKQFDHVEYEVFDPAANQVSTFMDIAIQSVAQGLSEPEVALQQASDRVNRVMARQ